MKRKSIMVFTILFTLFSISNLVFAEPISNLTDISNHWAKENIEILVKKEAINGYEDNTFRPNETMTRAEFTKILVSLLHGEQEIPKTGHWSGHYMRVAFENNYTTHQEFANYEAKITRGEIARMLSRAMKEDIENIDQLKNQIKDFNQINSEYQDHIAKSYSAGIITGYTDGEFKSNNTATRAEATTMVLRFLDESKRQIPEIKEIIEEKPVEKENYKSVTELFERELLTDYISEDKGIIEYNNTTHKKVSFERVGYVYKIQKSDLPIKIGEHILYSIEPEIEVVGAGKNRTLVIHQSTDDNYNGLHMNIADKNFETLRARNNYNDWTPELAPTPKIDKFENKIYKTYYGLISIIDGESWKIYDGKDAHSLIFTDKKENYAVIVENAFDK